ncbi:protein-glutamate O-methyltransferase CheR [Paenalkalicoccus suaedae]|uniref:protein-glutamate O-methyltransferase n=2 Tax=Paenalkalicoccus suaedae TaxID=2592382 RepID=A0A859FET3_9BACI|nr:protein-glutamate O-methyltransferase CheR [Paenalkalicoccus suaedae]
MNDYQDFIQKIYKRTGIDLSLYKEAQMKRRLTSLREKRGFDTFQGYYNGLVEDNRLFEEFLDRMTINVSEFFRNKQRWDILDKKIVPKLLENKGSLKVWSAACSTGEEPYTLSILLRQHVSPQSFTIQASDLDQSILERAKKGFYPDRSLKEVNPSYLSTYFEKEPLGYKVKPEIQKPITFKKHNLLADSFDRGFDLIVCRNVMIYFTEDAKVKLYHKFSEALRPGGILFVGSTEQIFNPQQYKLETEDTFFYKKMG